MINVLKIDRVPNQDEFPEEGSRRIIGGEERVFYDGYWIKVYKVPADTLEAKKRLIDALTRRLFNHTEHGLNIPGTRLAEAQGGRGIDRRRRRQDRRGSRVPGPGPHPGRWHGRAPARRPQRGHTLPHRGRQRRGL